MATITYKVIKSGTSGNRGVAIKGDSEFVIRELLSCWKMKSGNDAVKVELVYSKKDFPTFESICVELKKQGFEVK